MQRTFVQMSNMEPIDIHDLLGRDGSPGATVALCTPTWRARRCSKILDNVSGLDLSKVILIFDSNE